MSTFFPSGIKSKLIEKTGNKYFKISVSTMQGRRNTMEDFYSIKLDLKNNTAYAGIFDGHNGIEAAKFISENMPKIVSETLEAKLIINKVLALDDKTNYDSGTTIAVVLGI